VSGIQKTLKFLVIHGANGLQANGLQATLRFICCSGVWHGWRLSVCLSVWLFVYQCLVAKVTINH